MAIIYEKDNVVLVSHSDLISYIYREVKICDKSNVALKLLQELFCISDGNNSRQSKKRSHDSDKYLEETLAIKDIYSKFVKDVPSDIKEHVFKDMLKSRSVRDLAKEIFERTIFNLSGVTGGNNSNESLKCEIQKEYFLIPPLCSFYIGDVSEQCRKITDSKFNIVVADPPWWNKYIRRLKASHQKLSYNMMYNKDIASIPVQNLLSENCLIAMWCTNSSANISAIKDQIFPKWGVKYIATWYWLKIKNDMEPLCEFSSCCKKQPYERIVLGTTGKVKNIPDQRVLVSVPSALHSHKPPLNDLLKPYMEVEHPRFLELFARYILPNTTSVGYEPLKWQHISLYEHVRLYN